MKEMYNNYKKILSKRNNLILLVLIVFIIGLVFGSIYITIISNNQKAIALKKVTSFFNSMPKATLDDKLEIFKNSFYSNILYIVSMWVLGISIIGIPIIFIMVFFKSFILGFSVSNIFAKYGIKGLTKVLIYLFPTNIIMTIFIIFLSSYSISISTRLFSSAFKKQTINFKTFMGKYFFILVIGILISILSSLYDAFLAPIIYNF